MLSIVPSDQPLVAAPVGYDGIRATGENAGEAQHRSHLDHACRQSARPRSMLDLIAAREAGQALDEAAFEARSAEAVRAVVAQQVGCGIDVVSDGEQSKPSYATY